MRHVYIKKYISESESVPTVRLGVRLKSHCIYKVTKIIETGRIRSLSVASRYEKSCTRSMLSKASNIINTFFPPTFFVPIIWDLVIFVTKLIISSISQERNFGHELCSFKHHQVWQSYGNTIRLNPLSLIYKVHVVVLFYTMVASNPNLCR